MLQWCWGSGDRAGQGCPAGGMRQTCLLAPALGRAFGEDKERGPEVMCWEGA